ncbi:Holliday junction branch migration protein RuvA [Bifidobacterium sp. SO4]|uniref:Holliday junction branch migration protein RuvA n=1 Tax=Bifidobacterium sp. SO4 TaxID=2809030 RepID=UPI001BDCA4EE|nr:Holliday junction branch migration protein RuvA [Bifidobacterium sp. SO4]MBT1170207.1 Holliday junction branch migration protein RuvA [Bifidobacterium sp. SO4]
MIGMLSGRVESVEADTALIDVGGVGYEVRMSSTDLGRLHAGQETRVYTYMNISQDAVTLHGFLDRDAKKTFLQLIKVSGIGPKVAQSLLSTLTPIQLAHAIADNDATALAKAPGLGKKGAQKIILELKGSIDLSQIEGASAAAQSTAKPPVDTGMEQVIEGLISLGWRQQDAQQAVTEAINDNDITTPLAADDVPRVLRFALALMDRGR